MLAFVYPGDVFGESAAFDDGPRDHGAEAFERAVIYAIGRDLLAPLMGESSALVYELSRIVDRRLRLFRDRVEGLLHSTAIARVAQVLLDLAAQRDGITGRPGTVDLRQDDLAQVAGLSRRTVSRVLQDLRQRQLIEIGRRSIRLSEPEALRTLR